MKFSFKNDYSEGAHPRLLKALIDSNLEQEQGYGYDSHSENAINLIKDEIQDVNAKIHLLSGGTQTNLIAISAFLRPHEACIAAETGHIAVHETGAIEATGHKICTVQSADGKLTPDLVENVINAHQDEHMVLPRLVYISNPTELGTVYSYKEIKALRTYCDEKGLLLYCDGARLGTVLCQPQYGIELKDLHELTDAFFIGATKIGALLGEALIIRNQALQPGIEYIIKQRGALLAKGRLLGIQFEELFKDGLYYELAAHSINMVTKLTKGLKENGCNFLVPPATNQLFPILENKKIEALQENFDFYVWKKVDENHSAIRLITSWATKEEAVDALVDALKDS